MIARLTLILAFLCGAAARADDSFTKSLSPEDFASAGLGKLTPEELARLDALVRGKQKGAVAKATEETTKKVAASIREQVQAEERAAANKQSFIDRMKVVLKPGTEIDYTTLDATLVPPFRGYRKGTVLVLTNGQMWVVSGNDSDWETPSNKPVHVRIVPGSMGSFFMEIEGSGRPRVKFLGNTAASGAAPPAEAH